MEGPGLELMYRIDRFDTDVLVALRDALHAGGGDADSMEAVAEVVVRHIYDNFTSADGAQACALVRFYKTHRYSLLPDDCQHFVQANHGAAAAAADAPCLTLLASAGLEPGWNDVRSSRDHQAIPLRGNLDGAPMIATLIRDLGVDEDVILNPPEDLQTDVHLRQYNVFYVGDALGSPAVPAQDDFVIPYGIRSVVGFGGVLASGDMFAVIFFTTVPVPENAVASFRTLATIIKTLVVPHTYSVFEATAR